MGNAIPKGPPSSPTLRLLNVAFHIIPFRCYSTPKIWRRAHLMNI